MEQPSTARVRRSPATWVLLGLGAVVTALPLVSAIRSVLRATGVLAVDPESALDHDHALLGIFADERSLRVAEGYAALVSVPVALSCLLVLVGIAAWKDWAREGALGVFGLGGLFLLVLSLSGLTADPPGRHSGLGVLGSLVVLAVAALAVSPQVRGDFERVQILRARRAREAAAAERRARDGAA